jgi:hypothetical protein
MDELVSVINIYIDSSALRTMSFNREVASMLALTKAGKIQIYISETTLWERGRQQYENDIEVDRLVPFPDGINRYLAWFKILFEQHGVIIIPSNQDIINRTVEHIQGETSYFNQSNGNDQRDAHILATAELNLDRNTIILCNDKKLAATFEGLALFAEVHRDSRDYLQKIIGEEAEFSAIEKPSLDTLSQQQISSTFSESFKEFINEADHRFQEYLRTLPNETDKLNAMLENMQEADAEIRKRILGYIHWFSPIQKSDLHHLLEPKGYDDEKIEHNARRLKQEEILIETERYWLTNKQDHEMKEVCEQAMSLVMPEILEIMELS